MSQVRPPYHYAEDIIQERKHNKQPYMSCTVEHPKKNYNNKVKFYWQRHY